jgi:hypothetical protein
MTNVKNELKDLYGNLHSQNDLKNTLCEIKWLVVRRRAAAMVYQHQLMSFWSPWSLENLDLVDCFVPG